VDIFDLIATFHVPGAAPRSRDPRENAVAAIAMLGFPLADFSIVLFAGAYTRPLLALIVLPLLFAVAALLLARALKVSAGPTLKITVLCVIVCFLASVFGLFLGGIASLYSGF
jgi:hypothetical protein